MKIFGFGLVDTPSLVSVRKTNFSKKDFLPPIRRLPACPFCRSDQSRPQSAHLAEGSQAIQIILDSEGSEKSTVHLCLTHARTMADQINSLLDGLPKKNN